MTITAVTQTYGQATLHMGLGRFNFTGTDELKCMLASSTYVPDIDNDSFRSDIEDEIVVSGYTSGGESLIGVSWVYEDTDNQTVLRADPLTFLPLATSVRYAILYGSTGASSTDPLLAYIDFQENVDMTSTGLTLSWASSGILASKLSTV